MKTTILIYRNYCTVEYCHFCWMISIDLLLLLLQLWRPCTLFVYIFADSISGPTATSDLPQVFPLDSWHSFWTCFPKSTFNIVCFGILDEFFFVIFLIGVRVLHLVTLFFRFFRSSSDIHVENNTVHIGGTGTCFFRCLATLLCPMTTLVHSSNC